ncbi:hypothetical protein POKO110462_19645 [Pontibacter korlensis]|uniref:hypothetical protein n=1 Tax=Pontibacter korlensis TaxID=400092 RepID=UPI0006988AA4|nr:hypothetical protein [Pontibacter korlensis]
MKAPRGKTVAIGGNEDKGTAPTIEAVELRHPSNFLDHGILKRIYDELFGLGTRIEVITTATRFPDEVGKVYTDAFLKLGCDNVGVLPIQEPADAWKREYLERLCKTNCIMLSGGNQVRLPQMLSGTEALCVENLILHVLPKGQQYHLNFGEFTPR